MGTLALLDDCEMSPVNAAGILEGLIVEARFRKDRAFILF